MYSLQGHYAKNRIRKSRTFVRFLFVKMFTRNFANIYIIIFCHMIQYIVFRHAVIYKIVFRGDDL